MTTPQNTRLGIWLMIATCAVFAAQDGISRHLAAEYNVTMVIMIRFWFFAGFVILFAARAPGGLRGATSAAYPLLQIMRGLSLALQVCIMVLSFTRLGLIESHAVFASYPLLVALLSRPILGEKVGWRRWAAIGAGFVGMLIILQPGAGVFSGWALVPLAGSLLFALYSLLTRYVARGDTATVSFFWTGTVAAVVLTPFGLVAWQPMTAADWGWMAVLCCTGVLGHYLLIRSYAVAEASAVQPFAYFQLVFISALGLFLFNEVLRTNVMVGAAIVVAAGIFTLWRQRVREKQGPAR